MILRKPYAFLIKNFRKIHAVMALCLLYLLYKSSILMNFLNDYVSHQPSYVGTEITDNLFNIWMFFIPIIIIIACITVIVLMVNKKKPYKFYFVNIISSILVIIYYAYALNVIGELEIRVMDIRVMRAVRDLIVAVYAFQLISTIITFARATGFNIKQFDFGKDLKELEINEGDREEVEINININTDKAKRDVRRNFRFSKYFYLENKLVINASVAIFLVLLSFSIFMNNHVYNKTYTTTEYFNTKEFTMRIEDAYVTTRDMKGNVITEDDYSLVVLRIKIKKRFNNDDKLKLDPAKTALKLDGTRYYPIETYRDKLTDIGTTYEGQQIDSEYDYYLLTYHVPKNKVNSDVKEFNYVESVSFTSSGLNPNVIHIGLNFNNLDKEQEPKTYALGEEINFDNSILKESTLKITNAEINNTFKNEYEYCKNKKCYNMVEYLKPNINSNYDKTLIKFEFEVSKDEILTTDALNNMNKLINTFGIIEYKIGNVTKRQTTGFSQIIPSKTKKNNINYIEVVKEIENASEVNLILKVRNSEYIIKLK